MESLAWISLIVAFVSAIVIAADEVRHPQHMWIMNLVWPITALYFTVFGLWAYFALGRKDTHGAVLAMDHTSMAHNSERTNPTWRQTAVATSHCGATAPSVTSSPSSRSSPSERRSSAPCSRIICRRSLSRLAPRNHLPVFLHQAHPQPLSVRSPHRRPQGRYALHPRL